MPEIVLRIDGMHCGSCVRRVGQALASQGLSVKEVRVGAARFESEDAPVATERAIAALAKAGYAAHLESAGGPVTV